MPWRCWFVLKHQPSLHQFLGGGNSNSLRFTPPWGHDIIQSDDHIFQYFFSQGWKHQLDLIQVFSGGALYLPSLHRLAGGSGQTPWHCTLCGAVPFIKPRVVVTTGKSWEFLLGARIKVMKSESILGKCREILLIQGRNLTDQLRLVVYPIIYRILYITGDCLGILPSTVWIN